MYGGEGSYSPDAKKAVTHVHSLPRRSLSKICKLAGDAAVGTNYFPTGFICNNFIHDILVCVYVKIS